MSSHVEQIKERLGIVDIVSSYVKLEKSGANFIAKCPFHNEKTPSFFVSPARNTYYCFGCGMKGDIFSFVEQFEGTDFRGALKTLADKAGVELTPVNREAEDKKTRLYSALEEATVFFEKAFGEHSVAKKYVLGRGMTTATLASWRVGYAPSEWRALQEHLLGRGYTEQELLDAGLIKRSEKGSCYDRFRGRVMFPIMDSSGRVIAYSGRILPDSKNTEYTDDAAKYINSPETALYAKSHVLYGYHRAKNTIRKHDFSILVEGQMDVVLSHQAGYPNTVAASGTALTSDQLVLLARLSNNLVMAFDADTAGIAAGGRGIDLALARGMDVKVAALPTGLDPADLVQKGVEDWKKAVRSAKHVIDFYLDHLSESHEDIRKLRLAVGRIVIPYVASIPNRIDQAHFVSTIAARLSIAEEPVWDSVRGVDKDLQSGGQMYREPSPQTASRENKVSRDDVIVARLLGILLWQEGVSKKDQSIDVKKFRLDLEKLLGKELLKKQLVTMQEEGGKAVFEVERLYIDIEKLDQEVEDLSEELKRERTKSKYEEALVALRQAEEGGVAGEVKKALDRCRELSEALS